MPRVDHLPPASRIFGRVHAFDLECPGCGRVLHVGRGAVASKESVRHWNRVSCRLTCHCGASVVVGLAVWPLRAGYPGLSTQPADTRPTRRQLLELRQMAQAFLLRIGRRRSDAEVNFYVTAECSCPLNGWAVACPVHGEHEDGGLK